MCRGQDRRESWFSLDRWVYGILISNGSRIVAAGESPRTVNSIYVVKKVDDIMDPRLMFYQLPYEAISNEIMNLHDIPESLPQDDRQKLLNYNNSRQGMITSHDFLQYSLDQNLSYESVDWFLRYFSHTNDRALLSTADAIFKHYTFFLDESNNCIKLRFKDVAGNLNAHWYEDFTLGGVVIDGDQNDEWIKELFSELHLPKNPEVKLNQIAKYKGDDPSRFADILKSKKLTKILDSVLARNDIYMHWSTQNLLYYSLADIVDSAFNNCPEIRAIEESGVFEGIIDFAKNVLYKYAVKNINSLLTILVQHNYPNIQKEDIASFCNEFIDWLDAVNIDTVDQITIDIIKRALSESAKSGELIFLEENKDRLLIEDFVGNYGVRVLTFPSSNMHFDQNGNIEAAITDFLEPWGLERVAKYDFLDSKRSSWIQLSDIFAGTNASLMAYVNTHNADELKNIVDLYSDVQKENLKKFLDLRLRSSQRNMYFDSMSKSFVQFDRMKAIGKAVSIEF